MKPMIALIATGVVLLLVMLYFGNKSFEGTFETNVYQNSTKYDKTAPIIKDMEKLITDVSLDNIGDTKTQINYNNNIQSKYADAVIANIEITQPNKNGSIIAVLNNDNGKEVYSVDQKLPAGLYTVIFYVSIADNKNYLKILKSVYVE